jgi:hypothetical protein
MGAAQTQGLREGVLKGVRLAVLLGQGSRSAVFLVHAEGLRLAPGGLEETIPPGVHPLRNGCYHMGIINVS